MSSGGAHLSFGDGLRIRGEDLAGSGSCHVVVFINLMGMDCE